MDEFSAGNAREPAPPAPPRWKGIQSLGLVHQINQRCIELLCSVSTVGASDVSTIVIENRHLWTELDSEARQRMARFPFVILDARFTDEPWWRRAVESRADKGEAELLPNGLPREVSEHLMHETIMFAWQTARWDPTIARMSFAMVSSVAEIIGGLSPHQIRQIASRESQSIRVRWADDPLFWRDLLLAAKCSDEQKLVDLRLHAKLILCGNLVQLESRQSAS